MGILELVGIIVAALVAAFGYGRVQRRAGYREGAETEYARQKQREAKAAEQAKERIKDAVDDDDSDAAAALERLRAEADRNAK